MTRVGASILGVEMSARFSKFLDSMPWAPSHVDWRSIPCAKFEISDDWEESVLEFSREYPLGAHEYLMALYDESQPSILCPLGVGLRDIDLIYSGTPGSRYICGVDLIDGRPVPAYEDFAEFDGFANLIFRA